MKIVTIKNSEIINIGYPFPYDNPPEGVQSDGTYVIYMDDYLEGLTAIEFIDQRYWDGTNIQTRTPRPSPFCIWSAENTWVVDEFAYMQELKYQRNTLLYKCDWTQLADAPLTTSQIEEAVLYRQALRDMTIPIIENPSLYLTIESAPWPSPPSFLGT